MGSIEMAQPKQHNYPIEYPKDRKSRSPFRQAISLKSPFYRKLSPIKFQRQDYCHSRQLMNSSSRSPAKVQKVNAEGQHFKPASKNTLKDPGCENNREKCEDIIKKVRNFNDFLLELKKKLKEKSGNEEISKQPKKEMSMTVKLQNERIELEKYKRLVERELSKTHSIEQINIESSRNGEKILTIHYENMLPTENKDEVLTRRDKCPRAPFSNRQNLPIPQRQAQKQSSNINQLIYLKNQFNSLKSQCKELGQKLSSSSIATSQVSENQEDLLGLKVKNQYVRNMLLQIDEASVQSEEIQKNVRSLY